MINKPEIVFTFPACMGGVASFNYNIINYSKLIKKFRSKVILLRAEEDNLPLFLETFQADEVISFNYSHKENRYKVHKRLNKLLGNDPGCIVTDNGLTVYAAKQCNNPKTIYHLLHDFYYVGQVMSLGDLTDIAIAHSSFFSDAVYASNPALFAGRCKYIPYGVKQLNQLPNKENGTLRLVFLGRMDESKGVQHLYEINKLLLDDKIETEWTIIGKGPLKDSILQQWENNSQVQFHEPDSTDQVYSLLSSQDIFVFPTTFEGTPVSIMEALSNAVVTITNDLPGGIRDMVTEKTGFRCSVNDWQEFATNIKRLHENRNLLRAMQEACFADARNKYDIQNNADLYFTQFLQFEKDKRSEHSGVVRLSRLDRPMMPNALVKLIRSIR